MTTVYDLLKVKGLTQEQADLWLDYYNNHLEAVPRELLSTTEGQKNVVEYINFMVYK